MGNRVVIAPAVAKEFSPFQEAERRGEIPALQALMLRDVFRVPEPLPILPRGLRQAIRRVAMAAPQKLSYLDVAIRGSAFTSERRWQTPKYLKRLKRALELFSLVIVFVASIPFSAAGARDETIVLGADNKPVVRRKRFTSFIKHHPAGELAWLGPSGEYYVLEKNADKPHRLRAPSNKLWFAVSNRDVNPTSGPLYLGVEALRVFKRDPKHDMVHLYRNAGWFPREKTGPVTEGAPELSEFLNWHRGNSISRASYLERWHARVEEASPSSWEDRKLIVNSLYDDWKTRIESGALPDAHLQGTYRLIRFVESSGPRRRNRVDFWVDTQNCTFLLVRLFSTSEDYNGIYVLRLK